MATSEQPRLNLENKAVNTPKYDLMTKIKEKLTKDHPDLYPDLFLATVSKAKEFGRQPDFSRGDDHFFPRTYNLDIEVLTKATAIGIALILTEVLLDPIGSKRIAGTELHFKARENVLYTTSQKRISSFLEVPRKNQLMEYFFGPTIEPVYAADGRLGLLLATYTSIDNTDRFMVHDNDPVLIDVCSKIIKDNNLQDKLSTIINLPENSETNLSRNEIYRTYNF